MTAQLRPYRLQRAMTPETLERVLDAIPSEPTLIRFAAHGMDYSVLSPQLQEAVPELEARRMGGEEFYAANPTKGLIKRIYAATQLWQRELYESSDKIERLLREAEEGKRTKEDADAEITALEKFQGDKRTVLFNEAVWHFQANHVILRGTEVLVAYTGESQPAYIAALSKAIQGTGIHFEVKGGNS